MIKLEMKQDYYNKMVNYARQAYDLFKTDFGLPVCKYQSVQDSYSFTTLPIDYTATVIATNKSNKSGCLFNLFVFENTECIINMASKLLNLRVSMFLSL